MTKKEAKQLKQLLESGSDPLFNRLFQHYCHSLVQAIQKFRSFKQIQSQINPTIMLDGDCYDLYSKYDEQAHKNRWFLNIMSLESGKRIKGLELTGFHHAKQIMKHRKSANLILSFDPNNIHDGVVYAHFTFGTFSEKPVRKGSKKKTKLTKNKQYKVQSNISPSFTTLNTVGWDFGLTECFTFSDGWVAGRTQGELLKDITTYTQTSIKKIHKNSKVGYFGLEKIILMGEEITKETVSIIILYRKISIEIIITNKQNITEDWKIINISLLMKLLTILLQIIFMDNMPNFPNQIRLHWYLKIWIM